jgi:hypothetical protein
MNLFKRQLTDKRVQQRKILQITIKAPQMGVILRPTQCRLGKGYLTAFDQLIPF